MSSSGSAAPIYSIASLPRPLSVDQGHYHVAGVWGWGEGSKKRKRAELAVGIDGEGVNIYDVRVLARSLAPSRTPRTDVDKVVGGALKAIGVVRLAPACVAHLPAVFDPAATRIRFSITALDICLHRWLAPQDSRLLGHDQEMATDDEPARNRSFVGIRA